MTVDFSCPHCAETYRLDERFVGKKAKCKKCGKVVTIAAPAELSAPDPAPLPDSFDAPVPPPLSPASTSARALAAPTAPPMPHVTGAYAAPLPTQASTSLPFLTRPLLNETVSKVVGLSVVTIMLLLQLRAAHGVIQMDPAVEFPQAFERFQGELKAISVMTVLVFIGAYYLLFGPALFLAAAIGSSPFKKDQLPENPWLRCYAAIALAVGIPVLTTLGLSLTFDDDTVLGLQLFVMMIVITPLAVRECLQLSWGSTAVTMVLAMVFFAGCGWLTAAIQRGLAPIVAPEIAKVMEERTSRPKSRTSDAPTAAAPVYTPPAPPPAAPAIDRFAAWDPLVKDADKLLVDAPNLLRSQLSQSAARLIGTFDAAPLSPESPMYLALGERVGRLRDAIDHAPTGDLPASLTAPIADISKLEPGDEAGLAPAVMLGEVSIRPLSNAELDLTQHQASRELLHWTIPSTPGSSLTLRLVPKLNASQTRPWVTSHPALVKLAQGRSMYVLPLASAVETAVSIDGLTVLRYLPDQAAGPNGEKQYFVAPMKGRFVEIALKYERPQDAGALEAMALSLRASSGLDPFATPALIARLDTHFDQAAAILQTRGQAVEEAVLAWVKSKPHAPSEPVIALLRKIGTRKTSDYLATLNLPTEVGPAVASPANPAVPSTTAPAEKPPVPAKVVLEKFALETDPAVKLHMIESLVRQPPDSTRAEIAQLLEQLILSPGNDAYLSAAGSALTTWHRPQTVAALLPMLEENTPVANRQAAMKAVAATQDPKAVFPVLRWIIKDPEATVAAAIALGPAAELEVIKLLRQPDQAVRRNAVRILQEIGTSRSITPLRNACDTRDPVCTEAKAAHAAVVARRAAGGK